MSEYEKDLKALETKYDGKINEKINQRNEIVKKAKDSLPNFWYNALSNHKLFKDFIAVEDAEALRYLSSISFDKSIENNVRLDLIIWVFQTYFHFL